MLNPKEPPGVDPDIWKEWTERRARTWTFRDKLIHWLRGFRPFGYTIVIVKRPTDH